MILIEESFLHQNQSIFLKKALFVLGFIFPPPSFLLISYTPLSFLGGGKETKISLLLPSIASQNKAKGCLLLLFVSTHFYAKSYLQVFSLVT